MRKSVRMLTEAEGIDLLERIAGKDKLAFERFYYEYAGAIGAYLMKLLKMPELVDAAVNDFMLAVWQSAGDFDPARGKLSTWLFGIAHHKGLNILERHTRHPMLSLDEIPEENQGDADPHLSPGAAVLPGYVSAPERDVMGWELGEAMQWAFTQLSADHRGVLELCFGQACTYQEMAEIMGCPVNTVKTRMFHARKRLSELLAQRGFALQEVGIP